MKNVLVKGIVLLMCILRQNSSKMHFSLGLGLTLGYSKPRLLLIGRAQRVNCLYKKQSL